MLFWLFLPPSRSEPYPFKNKNVVFEINQITGISFAWVLKSEAITFVEQKFIITTKLNSILTTAQNVVQIVFVKVLPIELLNLIKHSIRFVTIENIFKRINLF